MYKDQVPATGSCNGLHPKSKFLAVGNYAGMNDGGTGSTGLATGVADHQYMWRKLAPGVTATFADGNTTWFSYVSARGYNANARAPSLTLGAGILFSGSGEQRGESVTPGPGNSSSEAIAVGAQTSGTTSGSIDGGAPTNIGNVSLFFAQYFNSTGTRSVSGTLGGAALSSVAGAGPQPGDYGYWMQGGGGPTSLLNGYSSAYCPGTTKAMGDNQSHVNITVARIQWGAGPLGEDIGV